MLNVMRENLRHLKWVLWIVAISMVLYLGAYFSCERRAAGGLDADWVARVDGNPIPRDRFLQLARRLDSQYRQLLGDQYERFRPQLQLGQQTIATLVDQMLMRVEAERLGLAVTPQELSRKIVEDPYLQGPDGKFIGKERYTQFIERNYRGGVAAFERDLRDGILVDKWKDLVAGAVEIDEEELRSRYWEENDTVEVDYAVVPAASQNVETNVDEATLRAWFEAHREDYRRPEGRRVKFFVLERQRWLAETTVSDDEIRTYYEDHPSEFARPEQRRARHILLRVAPDAPPETKDAARRRAQALLDQLRRGEAQFEATAREVSEDRASADRGGDLGFFGRGEMLPEFEAAVFETAVGEYAPLTETVHGFHIIQVLDSRPAGLVPLEEARDTIRRRLLDQRLEERVRGQAEALAAQIATPEDLERIAAREGLRVQQRVVRRGESLGDLGSSPAFMDAVFATEPGAVTGPVGVQQGLAIAAVIEAVPPDLPALEEVRSRVATDVLNERARQAAVEAARRALARHREFARAAEALEATVRGSGPLRRTSVLPGTGGWSEALRGALFGPEAAEGALGVAPVPSGAVLYRITKRNRPDEAAFAAARDEFAKRLRDERREALLQSLLGELRQRYTVEINQPLVAQYDR